MKIEHILVPVDFSEGSEGALCCALDLAEKFDSKLTLLHVVHPFPSPVGEAVFPDVDQCRASFLSAAAKELSNLARLIEPRIKAETAVSAGVEWAQIVEYATNHRVGLIIMSTHGRSGVKHILMGSVAERVVRHAPCAVMVVREHEPLSLTAP